MKKVNFISAQNSGVIFKKVKLYNVNNIFLINSVIKLLQLNYLKMQIFTNGHFKILVLKINWKKTFSSLV